MNKSLSLSKTQRREMIESLQHYFQAEREEELGELAAGLILDFIIEELAPVFFNAGVEASHQFFQDKLEDLFAIQIQGR